MNKVRVCVFGREGWNGISLFVPLRSCVGSQIKQASLAKMPSFSGDIAESRVRALFLLVMST